MENRAVSGIKWTENLVFAMSLSRGEECACAYIELVIVLSNNTAQNFTSGKKRITENQ